MRFTTFICASLACLVMSCSPGQQQPPTQPPEGTPPAQQSLDEPVSLNDLEREAADISSSAARQEAAKPDVSEGHPAKPDTSGDLTLPKGAAHYGAGQEGNMTPVTSTPDNLSLSRTTAKIAPEGSQAEAGPDSWRTVAFAGTSRQPARGLDPTLLSPLGSARERGYTYAFLILNERLSEAAEGRLKEAGVQLLGRHGSALKARVPTDPIRLKAVASLPFVESVSYAQGEQKLAASLREAIGRLGTKLQNVPVVISTFDTAALKEVKEWLTRIKAPVGRVDQQLNSVSSVVPVAQLDQLSGLDTVLYIELSQPGRAGHDYSMPVVGVDYIRLGGFGTRFSGAGTILGILDTGFMVGGAAATTHQDLNKFGCGRNFHSDAAGVWNDQNGHGTHVLATATGTGTAQARFRGAATGVGSAADVRIRAAKIWGSASTGTQTQEVNGMDYMDDGPDCGSARPHVVNISGGMSGTNLTGTDSRSRRLDQNVWDARQTFVVCSGNSGPGAGTIWASGVAKNALTVGNVLDNGDNTIGDINNGSSRGPTGDGRMKPTIVATGTPITSARAGTTNQYTDKTGCSMATPHVSGIVATLMDHYTEFRTLPHLVRAHLMSTALLHDNVAAPVNNTMAPDTTRNTYGLGRVSPYVTHWAHPNANGWTTHWAWRTITQTQWGFRDIDVPEGTRRLVVAMTWDEPAASAGAASAVDYDLDLWIDREPFCTPDSVGQCGEWASQSWIDNVEYQIIENPRPGRYRLKIINWDAPSSGLPAAISATIIRGATAPNMQLTASSSPVLVPTGGRINVTTTVSNPSWILSGVHLQAIGIPAGATIERIHTIREDNVAMDFTGTQLSLGSIVQGDSRTATWRVRIDTPGPKVLRFRARSENGGVRERDIVVNTGT